MEAIDGPAPVATLLENHRAFLRYLERLRAGKGLFAYELGLIDGALGDIDRAFEWFSRAIAERSGWIAYLRVDPRVEAFRADPRFADIVVDAAKTSRT